MAQYRTSMASVAQGLYGVEEGIQNLMSYSPNTDINEGEQLQTFNQLKDNEKKFLSLFDNINSIEDLQKKIDKTRDECNNFIKFGGKGVEQTFLKDEEAAVNEDLIYEQNQFDAYFLKKITSEIPNEIVNEMMNRGDVQKQLISLALSLLGQAASTIGNINVHFSSTQGWNDLNYTNNNIEEIMRIFRKTARNKLTFEQQAALKLIFQKGKRGKKNNIKSVPIIFSIDEETNQIVAKWDWNNKEKVSAVSKKNNITSFYTITQGKSASEFTAEELLQKKKEILDYFGSKLVGTDDKKTLIDIASDLFDKNPGTFLKGKASKTGIEGTLGEIAGIYFFRKLLNNNQLDDEGRVIWRGGLGNPHEDITILKKIGDKTGWNIQVKNTNLDYSKNVSQYLAREIEFATKDLNAMFQYIGMDGLQNRLDAGGQVVNWAEDLYTMYGFNQEASWNTNAAFKSLRGEIVGFVNQMTSVFAKFADILMFMSSERAMEAASHDIVGTFGGNTVYLIGGAAIYSAADIFKNILLEVQNKSKQEISQRCFQIHSTLKDSSGSSFTYEDWYKSGIDYTDRYGKQREHISRIQLTSSYKFTRAGAKSSKARTKK